MAHSKPCSTLMILNNNLSLTDSASFDQPSLHRSTVGALQYLTLTRLDLAFFVNNLSKFLKAPTVAYWGACKRVFKYVKGRRSYGLTFKSSQLMNIEGYSDANWASNLDDMKSVSCICVFLGGNLITWSSRK